MTATMATKWDVRVLALAGAGLMSLAGVFLWRELQVPHELLLAVAAVLASAVALAEVPRHRHRGDTHALRAFSTLASRTVANRSRSAACSP